LCGFWETKTRTVLFLFFDACNYSYAIDELSIIKQKARKMRKLN